MPLRPLPERREILLGFILLLHPQWNSVPCPLPGSLCPLLGNIYSGLKKILPWGIHSFLSLFSFLLHGQSGQIKDPPSKGPTSKFWTVMGFLSWSFKIPSSFSRFLIIYFQNMAYVQLVQWHFQIFLFAFSHSWIKNAFLEVMGL